MESGFRALLKTIMEQQAQINCLVKLHNYLEQAVFSLREDCRSIALRHHALCQHCHECFEAWLPRDRDPQGLLKLLLEPGVAQCLLVAMGGLSTSLLFPACRDCRGLLPEAAMVGGMVEDVPEVPSPGPSSAMPNRGAHTEATQPKGRNPRQHQRAAVPEQERGTGSQPRALSVFGSRRLAPPIMRFGGFLATRALRCASQQVSHAAGTCGRSLHIFGGHLIFDPHGESLAHGEELDFESKEWKPMQHSPEALGPYSCAASVVLDGCVYFMGGTAQPSNQLASTDERAQIPPTRAVQRFSPATKKWRAMPPMLEARQSCGAVASQGRIYVFGGVSCLPLKSVESIIPGGDHPVWERADDMAHRRFLFNCAAMGAHIYACGGCNANRGMSVGVLSSLERYEPERGKWEILAPMSQQRCYASAAVSGGALYVCGGFSSQEPLSSVERFSPHAGIWEPLPCLRQQRFGACLATLHTQSGARLWICGGFDGDGALKSTEMLDTGRPSGNTDRWIEGAPMRHRRADSTAVVFAGQVYVCGGQDFSGPIGTCESFDPVRGTWEELPDMLRPRSAASAAMIG